jgi:hypothetical protein
VNAKVASFDVSGRGANRKWIKRPLVQKKAGRVWMWKLPVLTSPQKGANSQKRIYREISATCKSGKKQKYQKKFPFLPTCLTQCSKKWKQTWPRGNRRWPLGCRDSCRAFHSRPPPRFQSLPTPPDSRSWQMGNWNKVNYRVDTAAMHIHTYIHTYLCILYPLAI